MDQALVENAEHDVYRDQRGEDQPFFVLQRILKGLSRSLEGGVNGAGHAHLRLDLFERGNSIAQCHIGRQVEGERHGRILALMIDR